MRTEFVSYAHLVCTETIYKRLRDYSEKSPGTARLGCLPVALADVVLNNLKPICEAIEKIVLVIINLLGSLNCSRNYTIRDAIICLSGAIYAIAQIVVEVVITPFKFLYQFFHVLIAPNEARPISPWSVYYRQGCLLDHKEVTIFPNDRFPLPQQGEG